MKKIGSTKNIVIYIIIVVLAIILSSAMTIVIMNKKLSTKKSTKENRVIEKAEGNVNDAADQQETFLEELKAVEEKNEETKTAEEKRNETKITDTKKEIPKKVESNQKSDSDSKEATSDKYGCITGTLVQKDSKYYCMSEVSDGIVYSDPLQYYCNEGVILKGKKCYEKIIADAAKFYKCPDGTDVTKINHGSKYTYDNSTDECILKDDTYYAVGQSGCKNGFTYNSVCSCCLPNSDSECPVNHYVGRDGRCYAKPIFDRYSCENYLNDNVIQEGTKCSWEMVYDAALK